ncbi:MAG: transglutaminase-like domain-containing protein [Clostridiales Family XIII bacterium]|jgi:hypothetical protein|nr:transglutaminase-like domain-containing protein [Clostridiales Family XIII bacterium]
MSGRENNFDAPNGSGMISRAAPDGSDTISLEAPDWSAPEPPWPARFVWYAALLTLGMFGAAASFYSVFPIAVDAASMVMLICCCSALTTALFLSVHYRKIVLAALGVAVAVAWLFWEQLSPSIADGAVRVINTVIDKYGSEANVDFAAIPSPYADAGAIQFSTTAFVALLLIGVTLIVGWLLIKKRNALFPFLLTLPFPGVALVYTLIPNFAALMALGLFWLSLLLFVSPFGGRDLFSEKRLSRARPRAVFYGREKFTARPQALVALPLLALCMILVATVFPDGVYKRSEAMNDLRDGVVSGRIGHALFRGGGVAGNTNRVDLRHVGNVRYKNVTAIRVKTTKSTPDYLKGFVGSVYTGSGWGQLSDADSSELAGIIADARPQNYASALYQAIDELNRLEEPGESSEPVEWSVSYELSVENVNVNPRCVYSPYGLVATPGALAEMEFASDGFLRSADGMFGMDGYTLEGVALPEDSAYRGIPSYDDLPAEFWEWLTPGPRRLFESQLRYGAFVDERYTALPEDIEAMLDEYRAEQRLDPAAFDTTADFVLEVIRNVQRQNAYTLSPGPLPEGRDFVDYFLNENHRGYCVHFATSVALLLRSAGVPARYAEGFVVSPEDPQAKDGWINMNDSRAHAWAEIYVNGLGWLPVEATPSRQSGVVIPWQAGALGDMILETPSDPDTADTASAGAVTGSAASGSTSGAAAENNTSGGAATDPAADGDASDSARGGQSWLWGDFGDPGTEGGEYGGRGGAILLILTVAAVVALSLVIAARVRRRRNAAERNKRFGDADRSKAAIAVYAYAEKLALFAAKSDAGDHRAREGESATPSEGSSALGGSAMDGLYDTLPESLKSVIMKARFSRRDPTEEELKELIAYANELSNRVKNDASLFRRLIGRYLYGLF